MRQGKTVIIIQYTVEICSLDKLKKSQWRRIVILDTRQKAIKGDFRVIGRYLRKKKKERWERLSEFSRRISRSTFIFSLAVIDNSCLIDVNSQNYLHH